MRIGIGAKKSGYWVHLVDYIQRRNLWQVELFTDRKKLLEALQTENYDFLFLEHDMCQDRECNVPIVYFGEAEGEISCYQQADQILRQMESYLGGRRQQKVRRSPVVYGVYSPLGRSGKTSFSLAFAKQHSFFYMSMEEYGIKGKERDTMGELLYHILNRKEGIMEVIKELSEQQYGVTLIPSPIFASDLHLLKADDYRWFFQEIKRTEGMDSVIIDFGTGSLDHMEVLDYLDRVYIPLVSGEREEEKLRQFRSLFREINGDKTEKLCYIQVPTLSWQEEGFLERVVYTELAEGS